jgi:signal transduction histidine kinase
MLKLRLAQMKVEGPPEAAELLDEAGADLQASLEELRELARGIHPAILTDRGLEAAVRALAERSPVPVTLSVDDVPRAVEAAIYFVVAEGLTNVAKYARATSAAVTVRRAASVVAVEIADDGVGGADMAAGSGLSGLSDRVGALDGRVWVESPPGEGTSLRAEIPC